MTDHSDLIAELREIYAREARKALVLQEQLSALSSQSLSLSEARAGNERLRDFGGDAVDLAGRILENLGIGQDASKEPGADRRRDRIAAMVQRSFDAERFLSLRQAGAEAVGEIVMFGGVCKEVSWRKGKMPPVGTKLFAGRSEP